MDTSLILQTIECLKGVLKQNASYAEELSKHDARIFEQIMRQEKENESLKAQLEEERRINAELMRKIGQDNARENHDG